MDYPSAALNERAVKFDTEFRRKNRQVSFKCVIFARKMTQAHGYSTG